MCNNNGHCRKFDAGTMCPSYRVDARRAARDARPRQHAAPRALRPARRRLRVACGARRARPLRRLQGLPARVPDRRRHGEDEDRVHAPVAARARTVAAGARDRVPAALGAVGGAPAVAREPARNASGRGALVRGMDGAVRAARAAALAARHVRAIAAGPRRGFRIRRRDPLRRHVHAVLRAGERAGRGRRADGGRLPRGDRGGGRGRCRRRAAAVLRPDVPGRRARRRSAGARRAAWSRHWRRTWRAAPPSSAWSRRAC